MDFSVKDNIRPISDFRKASAQMIKKLQEHHLPIILTQRGRSVAVILDVDTYERLEYENRFRASVRRGLDDVKHGRTVPHEQVMKDARQQLHRMKKK